MHVLGFYSLYALKYIDEHMKVIEKHSNCHFPPEKGKHFPPILPHTHTRPPTKTCSLLRQTNERIQSNILHSISISIVRHTSTQRRIHIYTKYTHMSAQMKHTNINIIRIRMIRLFSSDKTYKTDLCVLYGAHDIISLLHHSLSHSHKYAWIRFY